MQFSVSTVSTSKTVLFQIIFQVIQFIISTQFTCQTVLFQAVQFRISKQFNYKKISLWFVVFCWIMVTYKYNEYFVNTRCLKIVTNAIFTKTEACPVGCRGIRTLTDECPGYDTKQCDVEVPVVLDLWGMRSTPSFKQCWTFNQFYQWKESNNTIHFPDSVIIRSKNNLTFKVYRIPTNKSDYIHFYSHHNSKIKIGFIIIIIIIIIMSRPQHGYPWPSLATPPYCSSLLAGPQGYIQYPQRAAVCRFELVVLLLLLGVHRSTSLMNSSLLLQQCPACLVRLALIVFVMGGGWPYSCCFVGCCLLRSLRICSP